VPAAFSWVFRDVLKLFARAGPSWW
jgi:hypothetical protein